MGIAGEVQARYSESRQVSLWLFGTGTISTCTATEHFSANYVAPRLDFDALLCESALWAGASRLDQVTVHALAEEQPQGVIAVGARRGAPLRLPARIVVAADGSGSRLTRQLRRSLLDQGTTAPLTGPEVRMTRFTAMRGYYEGMERLKDADGAPPRPCGGNSGRLPSGQACAARRSTATTCSAWVTLRRSGIP